MAKKRGGSDGEDLRLTTPEFRGSFVNLLKPRSFGDGDPKYTVTLVLPRTDPFWEKLERAIDKAAKKKFGTIPSNFHSPIRSGKELDLEEFRGMDFARLQSNEKPGVVDKNGNVLIERGEVYSGAWYRARIKPYAWEFGKKRGVSIQVDNVLKVKDDDAFSGKADAASDFAEYMDDDAGEDEDRPRRRSRGRDEEEEEEDDRPRRSRASRRDEEEEQEEAPRRSARRPRDEEEEEEPAPRRSRGRDEEEEEDERPRRSSRSRDDDEDEAPRRRRPLE